MKLVLSLSFLFISCQSVAASSFNDSKTLFLKRVDQSTSHSPEYNYNSFYSQYQNDEAYYFGLISFRCGNYIGNSDVYRDGVSTISNYGPDCLKAQVNHLWASP